ncbi:tRNA pseudouridine(13) synthase TruD [Thermoplasmatales archaeon AK]|nr:tRNA pseudouridine(13) synthase TruD [Thermoplasmatales archaeon AK]
MGIEERILPAPDIEAAIKIDPEDFVVDEIPVDLQPDPDGKFTIIQVRLTNWDTNAFLVALARRLGISKERITYGGTKDRRGVTTQYFCIAGNVETDRIGIPGCEVMKSFRTDKRLDLGDLLGNRFFIRLTPGFGDRDSLLQRIGMINAAGGFPNYFGPQRFGSIRPNTHTIGELIVKGMYREAVMTYLYDPRYDREDFRVSFGETGDVRKALKEYPLHLSFERSLLGYILEHGTYEGAFDVFPRYLRMMFIHAYQSYLFNRILSARIRHVKSTSKVFPGDLLYPVDHMFNPSQLEPIEVNNFNADKMQKLADEDKVRPTIPLPGYQTKITSGVPGELEKSVLGGLNLSAFRIPGHKDLWSKGSRRVTGAKPIDLEILGEDRLSFTLGKGIYATVFLRELVRLK